MSKKGKADMEEWKIGKMKRTPEKGQMTEGQGKSKRKRKQEKEN